MTTSWRDLTSARRARPPAVRGVLERGRLAQLLASARVLVLVAPAGFGKTTAVAAPWAAQPGDRAWLTLDADDTDPQVLAASLALAAEALPGGAAVGALLDAGASPRRVAARFSDVLDACSGLLVLDDAQHLAHPLTVDLLRELLDSGRGRVALLSRVPLPPAELAPFEAAGEVLTLSTADLAFTPQEIAQVFARQGAALSPEEQTLAHALTEGWPIAVRFLAQAFAQGRVRLADLGDFTGFGDADAPLGTLFAYLAQEVLGPLAPPLRDLLTRGSVFEDLTPALLGDVLGETRAAELLEALAAGGTFLTRAGAGVYRAHPLLRAHLRAELPEEEAARIAARAAEHFERQGQPRRALSAHLQAGNGARAAALLARRGQGWLESGRVLLVQRSLARLPRAEWTPELHALAGDALRLSSRYDDARREYAQAPALERALGEVRVALDTVQPALGWAPLEEAGRLATGEQLGEVQRLRAENLLNAGQLAAAVELEPALARGARYALRSGDIARALELARHAAQGETGGARAAQNHREGLLLASFLAAMTGDAPAAGAYAEAGQREGERLGSRFVRSLALARLGHARLLAGDEAAARAAYDQARALAQDVTPRLHVEPLMGLTYLAARSGQADESRALRAQALSQTSGDAYMAGLVHLLAALGAVQSGHAQSGNGQSGHGAEAEADFGAAHSLFESCGDRFGLAAASLGRFAADPVGESAAQAAEAARLYPFLLERASLCSPFQDRSRRAALLARLAQARPEVRGALRPLARALGYAEVPPPALTPGFEVRVQVLGRVSVTRSHEARAREWGRAKARDLLLLLAVTPGGLARDSAQELLFPGAEPGVGERNFRVTLHALGQVLEEGAESGVFLGRGDWIELRAGPDLHVDLWEAQNVLAQPAGTPGRLGVLLALPPRLADTDLSGAQREAAAYERALPEALAAEAHAALGAGQDDPALRAAQRALDLDPASEDAAGVLMRIHHLRRHEVGVQRVYAALTEALAELGLSPSPEFQILRQVLGGEGGPSPSTRLSSTRL